MKISNFSINRPVFTLVTMFLVIILGIVSFTKIPLKLIPDLKAPVGVVVTNYPGTGPEEVLDKVTVPLEKNLSTVPGLKNIMSTSREGSNLILLEFSWSVDIDEIQTDVLQKIDQTPLPDDAEKPRFLKFDPSQLPVMQLALRSGGNDEELQQLAENLEQELSRVEGVASVTVTGSLIKDIVVELDQEKLEQYKLTQEDIVNVISANEISLPGQTVISGEKELTTRIISTVDSADAVKDLVITVNPLTGEEITVGDVSHVEMKKQDQSIITRANEEPAVLMSVLQKSEANTAEVSEQFQKTLKELLSLEKYKDIKADVLFDQGEYIQIVIKNIVQSLILGALFASVVLFFFLRGIKNPLIISVAIPYSVIVTFVLIYLADFSLNLMTLGGLALGVGMLVDNSIVVIENINRHLDMGKSPKEAARFGVKEIGSAIIASTLTTIAVFVPVIFIEGIIGSLMLEFSLTIAFSLFSSLFVAVTVVPMLASRFLKKPEENVEEKRQKSKPLKGMERAIKWCLRHRFAVLSLVFIFLAVSVFGLRSIGAQLFPPTDEGFFTISVQLENGTALTETDKVVQAVENELKDEEAVDVYVSLVGSTQQQSAQGNTSRNSAEIYVKMKELDERDVSVFEFTEEKLKDFEKAAKKINESAEVSVFMHSSTGMEPNTLSFNVTDSNQKRLEENVNKIVAELDEMDEVIELSTDLTETVEEVQITVDKKRALENGLTPAQVALFVNDVTRGVTVANVTDQNQNIMDVKVLYDAEITRDIDQLKKLLIRNNNGEYVTLEDVTDISIGESPVHFQRHNQQSVINISIKYSNDLTVGEMSGKVEEKIEKLDLPEETKISYTGEQDLLQSTIKDLVLALILAVIFVYIVMAAQFESFKYPLIIMFSVPFYIVGVSAGLIVTNTPYSVMAVVGIIVLSGIVVNNAIVIVDYINKLKSYGMNSYDAIVQSAKDRLRPVLMMTLTTILGLLPLAVGIGEGSEINRPMGIVVIGGLISSTFLTLFVIPVLYSLFDKETRYLNRKRNPL